MEDRNPFPHSVVPGIPLATSELIRNFELLECTRCPDGLYRVFLTRTGYDKHWAKQHGVVPDSSHPGSRNLIRTSAQPTPDKPTSNSTPATETSRKIFLPLLTSTPLGSPNSDISKSPDPETLGPKKLPSNSKFLKIRLVKAESSKLLQIKGESTTTAEVSLNNQQIQRRVCHDREESNLMYTSVVPQSPEITPTIPPSGSRPTRKPKGRRGPKPKPVNNCRYCSKSIPPGFNPCTVDKRFYPEACKPCSLKYSELFVQVIRSRYSDTIYKCSDCKHQASSKHGCMVHLVKHANPKFRIRSGKNSTIKFS